MNDRQQAAEMIDEPFHPGAGGLRAPPQPRTWIEMDSSYLGGDGGDSRWLDRLYPRAPADSGMTVRSSFIRVGRPERAPPGDDPPRPPRHPGAMKVSGRHYSLALLALVDALVAEPSGSPLATSTSLDDVRATAFVVARETVAVQPDAAAIDRAMRQVDRRLADLRVPLRATGYLAARDTLGRMVAPILAVRPPGGT